jgi:hypothetical protein
MYQYLFILHTSDFFSQSGKRGIGMNDYPHQGIWSPHAAQSAMLINQKRLKTELLRS